MKQIPSGAPCLKRTSRTQVVFWSFRNPARALFVGLIRIYRLVISPSLPSRCKYYPSCSQYALDAVQEYGAARGFILAAWRVVRCNPLSYGGYDPVSRQKLFRACVPHGAAPDAAASGDDHRHACRRRHPVRG